MGTRTKPVFGNLGDYLQARRRNTNTLPPGDEGQEWDTKGEDNRAETKDGLWWTARSGDVIPLGSCVSVYLLEDRQTILDFLSRKAVKQEDLSCEPTQSGGWPRAHFLDMTCTPCHSCVLLYTMGGTWSSALLPNSDMLEALQSALVRGFRDCWSLLRSLLSSPDTGTNRSSPRQPASAPPLVPTCPLGIPHSSGDTPIDNWDC